MNPIRVIKGFLHSKKASCQRRTLLKATPIQTVDPEDFSSSLLKPTDYYHRAFQDFHTIVPEEIRKHREFFQVELRGFGEDAFHTMWWRLVRKFQPRRFLEIGVYRGQTLSLVSLLAKMERSPCEVCGISPFSSAGDSVSTYIKALDYRADTLANFANFNLPVPELLQAYSTDQEAVAFIGQRTWDMIYIDGNHDYEIVKADWAICSKAVDPGGLIVLDDSGLSTDYLPPAFATGGHPGPSRLASEIDRRVFEEVLQVGHNRVFRKIA